MSEDEIAQIDELLGQYAALDGGSSHPMVDNLLDERLLLMQERVQ